MKQKRKALLLIVCLLIFFPLAKTLQKQEEKEPEQPVKIELPTDIIVYNTREEVIRIMELEEYLVGVVAAEMPASFSLEALKAQAIAARTYALGRAIGKYGNRELHFGAHVCTNSAHCQAWIPKERYEAWYPEADVEKNWTKIKQAVYETRGLIITYDGVVINPLYHANSGGITEEAHEVWSSVNSVPYLQRVYSVGESEYSSFEKRTQLSGNDFRDKLMKVYPEIVFMGSVSEDIEIIQFSDSQRVKEIRVGSEVIPGTKFREIFSLASTQLDIIFLENDTMEIITYGFGHGVGMSQCGANELALRGKDYDYILKYYYTGVEIETIPQEIAVSLIPR